MPHAHSRAPSRWRRVPLVALATSAALYAQAPPDLHRALVDSLAAADRPIDLAEALDRTRAEQVITAAWSAWRTIAPAVLSMPVPDLPPTVAKLVAMSPDERAATPHGPWTIRTGAHEMPFHLVRKEGGDAPDGGRAMFVCMHGGGQRATVEGPHSWDVNTNEWRAQTMLATRVYPAEGLFVVPRMADDRLGRWWHAHNQDAFDSLIMIGVAAWNVDPNRVYLLGISEGGYGTDILAPFMADRFAAANAMAAGVHVHDNPPDNLRHLPFRTDIGADDTTYDRVGLARRYHARLDELHAEHSDDYVHVLSEQTGKGHGIDYRPGVAWLTDKVRDPWPGTVTWESRRLHDRRRPAFYWLALDAPEHDGAIRIDAHIDRDTSTVDIEVRDLSGDEPKPLTNATVRVMLRDEMLDLERPVTVRVNARVRWSERVPRNAGNILETLALRGDPKLTFPAVVEVALD